MKWIKNKEEYRLFYLLCDLENMLFEEDDWKFLLYKEAKLLGEVESLLNEWENMFKEDEEEDA